MFVTVGDSGGYDIEESDWGLQGGVCGDGGASTPYERRAISWVKFQVENDLKIDYGAEIVHRDWILAGRVSFELSAEW